MATTFGYGALVMDFLSFSAIQFMSKYITVQLQFLVANN